MNVVWSDEAGVALIALETRLAARYSAERAAQIVEEKPRSASGHPSVYQISIRITAEERDSWLAAAGEGRLADWIRSTLNGAARQRSKGKP